jgi:hypothetical protein
MDGGSGLLFRRQVAHRWGFKAASTPASSQTIYPLKDHLGPAGVIAGPAGAVALTRPRIPAQSHAHTIC